MNITDMINALEDVVLQGKMPVLSKKSIVNVEEILDMLDEMRRSLPEEIKAAEHVRSEKNKLIVEAQQEAEQIKDSAEKEVERIVQQSDIAEEAYTYGNKIVMDARQECEQLRQGTFQYLNDKIEELTNKLYAVTAEVESCRDELKEYLVTEDEPFEEELGEE